MKKIKKFFLHPVQFFKDIGKSKASKNAQEALSLKNKNQIKSASISSSNQKTNAVVSVNNDKQSMAFAFNLDKQWDELRNFESSIKSSSITIGGENIWPAMRYILWMKLWFTSRSVRRAASFSPFKIEIPSHVYDYYKSLDAIECDAITSSRDYLFYVNPNASDRHVYEGEVYNRIIDPLYEKLLQMGYSCEKICAIRSVSDKAVEPYYHSPIFILPGRIRGYGYTAGMSLPVDFEFVLKGSITTLDLNVAEVLKCIEDYFDQVSFFEEILKRYQPKAVFFINMGTQMPLIHAANRLGIATVELQHGVQQANTPIYKAWKYFIRSEYHSLPKYFGVWGEDEANYIRKEFRGEIKPLLLGYSWLDKSKILYEKIDNAGLKEGLSDLIDRSKIAIAVTMQNQEAMPAELIRLAKKYGDKVLWLVRTHPKWNKISASKSLPKTFIFSESIQNIPLQDFFLSCDLHVTRDSASIYEATYSGIKSYVYSAFGERAFPGLIDANIVDNLNGLISDLDALCVYIENSLSIPDVNSQRNEFLHANMPSEDLEKMTENELVVQVSSVQSSEVDFGPSLDEFVSEFNSLKKSVFSIDIDKIKFAINNIDIDQELEDFICCL